MSSRRNEQQAKTFQDRAKNIARSVGQGVIQYHIIFRLAYKNLLFKKLRTTLTVLGVIIGVGSVVFLISFGYGLQDLVSKQVVGSSSIQTVDVTTPRSKVLKLNKEAVGQIQSMASVKSVNKVYNAAAQLKYGGSQTDSVLFGADRAYIDLLALPFSTGSAFGIRSDSEVLINQSVVEATGLESQQKAIGKTLQVTFEITNPDATKRKVVKDLKVTGVYGTGSGAEMFVSSRIFEQEGATDASQLKVVVDDQEQIQTLRKNIESLGYDTSSPLDTLDQIDQVFTLLRLILIGFGGIGLIIAVLGMFNTLTISLLERTREVALMISLGARKQDVRRLFITEALLLSFFGGASGILAAIILGKIGNFILNQFAQSRGVEETVNTFVVSPLLVISTLLMSLLLGLIVVYFPARRASSINPIEALRNE